MVGTLIGMMILVGVLVALVVATILVIGFVVKLVLFPIRLVLYVLFLPFLILKFLLTLVFLPVALVTGGVAAAIGLLIALAVVAAQLVPLAIVGVALWVAVQLLFRRSAAV
jgi:hypothetical protein